MLFKIEDSKKRRKDSYLLLMKSVLYLSRLSDRITVQMQNLQHYLSGQ